MATRLLHVTSMALSEKHRARIEVEVTQLVRVEVVLVSIRLDQLLDGIKEQRALRNYP